MPSRSLKPVERPQALGEQVYLALRAQLRDGSILPGEALQEKQLAEQLGVSRTPVREALGRLASEGMLATDQRSFTVPALSVRDVDDIYEIRFLIEPAAISCVAALTVDAAQRAAIDAAVAEAHAAHERADAEAFGNANECFRSAWLALASNRRMVRVIEQYADHMQHIRHLTLGSPRVRTIVLRGLQRITAALTAGDGNAAAAAMRDHLSQAQHAFIDAIGLANAASQVEPT